MHTIEINHPSKAQMRKLRKGGKIRIRKGTGFQLNVHPETYNLVARAFNRNKGLEFGLTTEELQANNIEVPVQSLQQFDSTGQPIANPTTATNVALGPTPMQRLPIRPAQPPAPHMLGGGIFGQNFDRFLDRHHIRRHAYSAGDAIKPVVKGLASYGIRSAALAGMAAAPEFAIPIGVAGLVASHVATDYLDKPGKYQGTSGVKNDYKHNDMTNQVKQIKHFGEMNDSLGTNFDYMGRAGYHKASADMATSKMTEDSINARKPKDIMGSGIVNYVPHAHLHRLDRTMTGRGAPIVANALVSQPMNENFNMNSHLPPSFQVHKVGNHIHGGNLVHGYDESNPPAFASQSESSDFIRTSTKAPKKGKGLYASGRASGKGMFT